MPALLQKGRKCRQTLFMHVQTNHTYLSTLLIYEKKLQSRRKSPGSQPSNHKGAADVLVH